MGIFLRQSHNIKPPRWGSFADVQYAIRVNSEKIYDCDPDDDVLVMPLFWGLPPLDYSMYGNDGTNHGATYKDGSFSFDGVDDSVITNTVTFNSNVITVSFWINADGWAATTPSENIIMTGSVANGWVIYSYWNEIYAKQYGTFNWNSRGESVAVPSTNSWHHIAVIFDASTVAGDNQVFYDGIEKSTIIRTDNKQGSADFSSIAVTMGGASNGFDGLMDEVRISKGARTADQIALFHDNKYGLYQKVGRPIWSIPAVGVTIPIFMQNMRGSFNSPGTRGGFIN